MGSVKCEGREGGGGVPGVSWEVAIPDISLWGRGVLPKTITVVTITFARN